MERWGATVMLALLLAGCAEWRHLANEPRDQGAGYRTELRTRRRGPAVSLKAVLANDSRGNADALTAGRFRRSDFSDLQSAGIFPQGPRAVAPPTR